MIVVRSLCQGTKKTFHMSFCGRILLSRLFTLTLYCLKDRKFTCYNIVGLISPSCPYLATRWKKRIIVFFAATVQFAVNALTVMH